MPASELWQGVSEHLRAQLGIQEYETWIAPLGLRREGSQAVILAPNRFFIDWIREHYLSHIALALHRVTGQQMDVSFEVTDGGFDESSVMAAVETLESTPPTLLNPLYTFANFVVGTCNELAHAACQAVSQQPGKHYNPLFLFGGAGLGKTHLVTAVGNYILLHHKNKRVHYCTSEAFTNELIQAVRFDGMNRFQEKYRQMDCLIMEDVQFLAGRERTQEEFFHTFNTLYETGRQIIITSDKAPRDISGLEQRLCTRFESGLLCDLQPPDEETKVAILQRKSREKGLELSRQVAFFLARQPETNVRVLEGYLTRILAVSRFQGVEVTLDLARRVVGPLVGERRVGVEEVLKAVSSRYGLKVSDLKSGRKTRDVTHPRQVAMYLARRLTRSSFPEIGRALGGKDHSTVVKGVKKIEEMLGKEPNLAEDVRDLERELLGGGYMPGAGLRTGGM
ncbi:MAG: chromosomal replication initiator protein DnaA [Deltaproteobacteria bacterium]|nr:chromosomal replication initiator protein DnaA [Deltaproteobacteria bacterium]